MSSHLSVRKVPPRVAKRLKALARETGESINTTVLRIIEHGLGLNDRRAELERLQTWTDEDLREFEEVLKDLRRVDEDLWK